MKPMNPNKPRLRGLAVLGWIVGLTTGFTQIRTENFLRTPGGQVTFDFADATSLGSGLYEIQRSSDLTNWSLANFSLPDHPVTSVKVPRVAAPREFFRISRVELSATGDAAGSAFALRESSFSANGNPNAELIGLGRLLFFDKELSGNRNISCATCHHPDLSAGDGLSLSVGEGGTGLGLLRTLGTGPDAIHARIPRNAPHIFSMGANDITVMFHDGRLFRDENQPSGFVSPAGPDLPLGLDSPLAAQAMFPVTSADEMAGQAGENELANFAAAGDLIGLWAALATRLQAIPEYVTRFQLVFPDITQAKDITYVHAANAIGAFQAQQFRSDQSPFDDFLRGDSSALDTEQFAGMRLFYGKAGCAQCHSGVLQTDQDFHAIAMPQIGPGKGHGMSGREDWGRWAVTGLTEDKFRFRTPTLRNIALTAPYGHAGAYATLVAVVRHHLDPVPSFQAYDASQLVLPSRPDLDTIDLQVMNDSQARQAIADANELVPVALSEVEIGQILAFLEALTDPDTQNASAVIPSSVPSGLPVAD